MKEYVEVDLENLPYVDVNDTKIPAISLINGLPVAINGGSLKVYDWAKQPNKPIYNKAEVGLGLVENISPYDMPISTATQTALDLLVSKSMVGAANGVASLDNNGKVPLSQLDDSVVGGMSYQGSWDASTNTPDLTTVKPKGQYYLVGVAGTQFGKQWGLGDTIISNGTTWDQIKSIQSVQSVNGKVGVVVLTKDDIGLNNVDNTSDRNKPISVATQTALDNKTNLSAFNTHVNNQSNPHAVTKAQVGLGNVLNKEQLGKTETAADSYKLGGIVAANYYHTGNANLPTVDWTGRNLYAVGDIVAKKTLSTVFAIADDSGGGGGVLYLHQLLDVEIPNPLNNQSLTYDTASGKWVNKNIVLTVNGGTGNITIDKSTIGLGNVDNTSDANKPISTATLTALNDKANQSDFTSLSGTVTGHINNTSNPHNVTKSQVGLGNVDNTSDLNKPISTAVQTALNGKANKNGDVNEDFNVKNLYANGNGLFNGDVVAKKTGALIFSTNNSAGGSQYLYELLDVEIPTPSNNQSLVYSSSSGTWINKSLTANDVGALPSSWKPSWEDVTGKPTTFTPSPHTQAISTITGLQSALDGKQPSGNYEASFSKNTAFNKNFGSASNTVCEGNDDRLAAQANLDVHKADKANPHVVTKSQVGLENVDNTSDADKPISTAVQTALNGKANKNGDSAEDFSVKNLNAKENVVASGDVIAKKTGAVVFAASDASGGSQYLYQLLDVDIPTPSNNQSLVYSSGSQKWINKTLTASDVGALHSNWKPSWGDVADKPDTFTPSAHTQAMSTITGLQDALNGKQPSGNYEAAFTKNSAFNKNFGSSAGTVCEGNDSRLSDSRTASDVYPWAKAETKPSYNKGEVGLGNVDNISDNDKPISVATQAALNLKANKNGDSTEDFSVKNLNAKENITASGDIVAKKTNAVVFTISDVPGGSQYLHQLLDVEIPTPKNGDVLMFDGSKQKWANISDVSIDAGVYAII